MTAAEHEVRTYGGVSVEDRRAERRVKFLEAALSVFSDKGYKASTVADLCRSAGLARRQFYDEFSSREDALIALYDSIQNDAKVATTAAIECSGSSDPHELAALAMGAFVESIGKDARRARISFVDSVGVSPRIEEHRLAERAVWRVFFEATIRAAVGQDYVPPGGYAMASTAFIGALIALVQQWSTADPRPPVEDLTDIMVAFLDSLIAR
ncbi:TetR/AcrR family transcriptional regulator [Rhodococcus sp. G-MC3]|uniref:TetR/AcrR family transcriptional regulator n=1 Tax=Rhodococcus sp. G-MC3 TaxID=3046209 RepID=UPI0024BADAF1|nr:TetR/AcrR family transcriptional regulator [Rhodococcus sp. G-MC3]MDJ0392864.1 TetR/AcrR family transcriptional regulator [Rhodococcus sp. G-MC3]